MKVAIELITSVDFFVSSLFILVLFFARVSRNSNRWHTRCYVNTANGRETARIVDLRLDYSHFCKMNKDRERELGIGWKEKERVPIVMINHTVTKYNFSVAVELDKMTITSDVDYVLSTIVPAEIADRRSGCIWFDSFSMNYT